MSSGFDRIARPYRWLEYLSFGPLLARCRSHWLPEMRGHRRALVLGDGDGRFTARLLRENSEITVDAVDISPAMLALLTARAEKTGASHRVTTHCMDVRDVKDVKNALAVSPAGPYDLVSTHFFLDCLSTSEVQTLAETIRPHLAPDALWVVSDFDIPRTAFLVFPARVFIRFLYRAFGLLAGLETRRLPGYRPALQASGFRCKKRKAWLGGFLFSELWVPVND